MALFLVSLVRVAANVLSFLIIINVILSYVLSPYHPVRETIDRVLEPMLGPIRRLMPKTGMFDFSPIVLIILIQIIETILVILFSSLG